MAENVRWTLEEGAPLIEQPRETTSIDKEIREPVRKGHDCKLFCICTGKENDPYLYVPHFQKEKKKRPIYEGYYNCDVPVAIVRINPSSPSGPTEKEIRRELQILKELEVHENFIRYFTHEMNKDFVFIATELCLCSVADLLDPALEEEVPMKKKILLDLQAKEILRQATRGLSYLHQNNFIHRNIKPNNFLIKDVKTGDKSCRFVVKITDFRLTRKRDPHKNLQLSGSVASEGWEAPESRDSTKDLSTKLDVFILGCFYHYVLVALMSKNEANKNKPRHPFGDNEDLRPKNISDRQYSVQDLLLVPNDEDEKKVVELIKSMLKFNEEERPTLQQVLADTYFVPSEDYNIYKFAIPGLCVIFNQEKFENGEFRGGSDKDRDDLTLTFKKLGFDVEIHNNLTSGSLIFEIEDLAKERNFNDYGCLVVCLLSHGIEDAILGYDCRFVNTNELKYQFSLDNCPSLYGKPKVFIIQACQGYLEQSKTGIIAPLENKATDYSDDSTVTLTKFHIEPKYDEEKKLKKELKKLKILDDARRNPPLMDFLTIKATLPGFVSSRVCMEGNQKEYLGSIFIQSLCDILSEEYLMLKPTEERKHLEGLLKDVQPRMNEISEKIGSRQTMCWETCLSKNIRFHEAETEGNVVVKNQGEDYQVFT